MFSVIFSVLAATIPISILHWYLAKVESRPVPERHLGEIAIPPFPVQLRLQPIYVIMPAYIAVLGCLGLFWCAWLYDHTSQTRIDVINASPLLACSSLMILVGGVWFLLAIAQRLTITKSDITLSYGLGQSRVDLLDVGGFAKAQSFIFIHFKNSTKKLAIPTWFEGLDILVKVLSHAKHGRTYS